LNLPVFKDYAYDSVLKVLLHEILINIDNGLPLPNIMVYKKLWYRDATLMAMVLKETGNLRLIKDWILNIRDPLLTGTIMVSVKQITPGRCCF